MDIYSEPDAVLATIVATVNSAPDRPADDPGEGMAVGLTLTVAGTVVSGYLIPNWQWFDEMKIQIDDAGARGGAFAQTFELVANNMRTARNQVEAATDAVSDLPDRYRHAAYDVDKTTFVHLRQARVITGGNPFPNGGMHWRGRLSEVSGWCYGIISVTESGS